MIRMEEHGQCNASPCRGQANTERQLTTQQLVDFLTAKPRCRTCDLPLRSVFDAYEHDDGWSVVGFRHKLWLSLHCNRCNYDWSVSKIGIPREGAESRPAGN